MPIKRSTKILTFLTLIFIITLWSLTFIDIYKVLIPYVIFILFIGLHAAYSILSSIIKLKNHPE